MAKCTKTSEIMLGTIVQYGNVLVTLIDENQRRKKLAKLFSLSIALEKPLSYNNH